MFARYVSEQQINAEDNQAEDNQVRERLRPVDREETVAGLPELLGKSRSCVTERDDLIVDRRGTRAEVV
jgi:hypothetical protein